MTEVGSVRGKIPLRAEDAGPRLIRYLSEAIGEGVPNYIKSVALGREIVMEVAASKGVGKTLNVLVALHKLWIEEGVTSAVVYFDPETGRVSVLDPSIYCGDSGFADLPPKKIVESADVVVVDNWHYVADLVVEGYLPESFLDDLAKATLEEVETGKTVIVVTESLLDHYLAAGVRSGYLVELAEAVASSERKVYVTPPTIDELSRIYGVFVDRRIKHWWDRYSDGTPRTFARLVNEVGRVVTVRKVLEWVGRRRGTKPQLRSRAEDRVDETVHRILEGLIDVPGDLKLAASDLDLARGYLSGRFSIDEIRRKLEQMSAKLANLKNAESVSRYEELKRITAKLRKEYKGWIMRSRIFELSNKGKKGVEFALKLSELRKEIARLSLEPEVAEYRKLKTLANKYKKMLAYVENLDAVRKKYFPELPDSEFLKLLKILKDMTSKDYVEVDPDVELAVAEAFEELNSGWYYYELASKLLGG